MLQWILRQFIGQTLILFFILSASIKLNWPDFGFSNLDLNFCRVGGLCVSASFWSCTVSINSRLGKFFENMPCSHICLYTLSSCRLRAHGSRGNPVPWYCLTGCSCLTPFFSFLFLFLQMHRVCGCVMVFLARLGLLNSSGAA